MLTRFLFFFNNLNNFFSRGLNVMSYYSFHFYTDAPPALLRSVLGGSTGIDTLFMKKNRREELRQGSKKTPFSSVDVYNNLFSLLKNKK